MRLSPVVPFILLCTLTSPPAAPRPSILLITLDTTRADRMGFLGSTRRLTPALDAFARNAVVFTRAYSQAPVTTVSHATLLTGSFSHNGAQGTDAFHFTGRLSGRRLPAGNYRLTAVATDAAGNHSAPARHPFSIIH